ncbi:sensor domain-containing diguanylate cyclase [Niveibacterium microcysteis]|uniref:GGDEF domain-containing protein n=1 Tax=Niveibacterium microcysteis TaxID=2811415 RepID=A0ABX7M4U3_9RHOO|nr:sensor domain-containing diguanylate cyclase [Niveibacterium microcysteis]QSI76755.1 GGDEF domain-containing protein [Niveibacterium microcysteis]
MFSTGKLLEIIAIQTEIARLGADLGSVMQHAVERTLGLIGADGAAIELAEGDDMVYRASAGIAQRFLGLRLARGQSLSGACVALGQAVRCDDTELDSRADKAACRRVGLRSMIVLPLRYGDSTVGVLKAMSARVAGFTESDQRLLDLLAEHVAAAMFHAAKYDTDALFYRATHDAMTDLANRSLFMDRLRGIGVRAGREGMRAGVLVADLNGLKQINDGLGHRAGDALIVEFARRLKACARQSDLAARLGGDEFALILDPVDSPEGAKAAVARLESALGSPLMFEGRVIEVGASIGHALMPDDGCDIDALVDLADRRMYAAKRQQRGAAHSGRTN